MTNQEIPAFCHPQLDAIAESVAELRKTLESAHKSTDLLGFIGWLAGSDERLKELGEDMASLLRQARRARDGKK